jgi:hypothetical protein
VNPVLLLALKQFLLARLFDHINCNMIKGSVLHARGKNMNSLGQIKAFVSSTSEDLRDYRAVARNVILDMNWYPVMMEHFRASPSPTVEACKKTLAQCNLVLLIVAHRRGWVPTREEGGNGVESITALELKHARKLKIPVLAMLAVETWPGNLWEEKEKDREWIRKFRDELNLPAVFFDHEPLTEGRVERFPSFRAKVRELLISHRERLLEEQSASAGAVPGIDYFESAGEAVRTGEGIPFVGSSIYEEGPLSSKELCCALGGETCGEPECLATVAEYRERYLGSRERFLKQLHRSIEEQSQQATVPAVYEMIASMPVQPMIVSVNYDHILEDCLTEAGKTFVVVSHIVRSLNGQNDGKILVFREQGKNDIFPADKVDLKQAKLIIYKPLGSPHLNNKCDPDLEIDTVVITETDHLTFLGRLENELTKIPTALNTLFRKYPLIFLGYALDVWHYRLVMQVFQAVGESRRRSPSLAIRDPASAMEEIAWKRLAVDLIKMQPKDFASRMSSVFA